MRRFYNAFVDLRGTVPLLMMVVACGQFNRISISVAGTERIIPGYGLAPEKMGLVYSAFLVFYTLAMMPGGWFIDRFGARAALVVLGFGSTIFVALTGCVGLLWHEAGSVWLGLLVIRSCLGLLNAPLHPASARMVFANVPARSRGFANGLVTFSACLGISATYYVMGTLMERFDWPVAFLITSSWTLLVALAWTYATRSSGGPESEANSRRNSTDPSALWTVLRRPSVICIMLSYTAQGYFQYLFFYWIGYYFETIQGQPASVARGYSTMVTLAMGLGMVSGGWLTDRVPHSFSPRLRRALVPVLGMILSGLVFELGLLAPSGRMTLAAFALAAALLGTCEGAFWTMIVELGHPFGGTAGALMNTGGNVGGALSPFLTPLLGKLFAERYGDDLGWRLSLAVAGVIVIAGAAFWWGVNPAKSPDSVESTDREFAEPGIM